jgi:hypothetical protein
LLISLHFVSQSSTLLLVAPFRLGQSFNILHVRFLSLVAVVVVLLLVITTMVVVVVMHAYLFWYLVTQPMLTCPLRIEGVFEASLL